MLLFYHFNEGLLIFEDLLFSFFQGLSAPIFQIFLHLIDSKFRYSLNLIS